MKKVIEIDGNKYEIDLAAALNSGIAIKLKKKRRLRASDIPNASLIRYSFKASPFDTSNQKYVMIDNKLNEDGQVICVNDGKKTWFNFTGNLHCTFEYLDADKQIWISEVEE